MSDTSRPLQSVGPSPFLAGVRQAWGSVFAYVLIGTYVGIGALAHDYGFSVAWVLLSTVLVWAAPAQVILISALGAGANWLEVAIAVTLSSVRLLPMVVALMPLLRDAGTRARSLVVPAHFTAVSMWVESLRLLPGLRREERIAFCSGLGTGLMSAAFVACAAGYYLAAGLPRLLTACLLFLTPMSFLVSVSRNSRDLVDRLAFGFGLVVGPLVAAAHVGLDLMWTGLAAGSAAYAIDRWRRSRR